MKHIISLIVILVIFISVNAQPYTLDHSFAPTYSFWDGGPYYGAPWVGSVIERDDSRIYVGGHFQDISDGFPIFNIAMFHSDGSLNTNFQAPDDPGYSSSRLYLFNDTIYSISTYVLFRFDGNTGDFDWTFHDTLISEVAGSRHDIHIFDDGTMFIAMDGSWHLGQPETYDFWLGKLKRDGHLDTTFRHGPNNHIREITKYDDDRFLLDGLFTQYDTFNVTKCCRIFTDGTLDTSYHNIFSWGYTKPSYIQPDGKIIVTGFFTLIGSGDWMNLVRLNSDGSLDTSFNNFNNMHFDGIDSNYVGIGCVLPTSDGKLLIGNYFKYYQGYPRSCIVLTDSNGFIDTTAFNGSGFELELDTTESPIVGQIVHAQNNTYYIGGRFSSFNGEPVKPIIRIYDHTWGIEETTNSYPTITIYPNPTTDIININLEKFITGDIKITLYNINGSLVKNKLLSNLQKTNISTSNIKPGIYICEVSVNSFIAREKIVIVGE